MADYTSTPFSTSETVSCSGSAKYFYVSDSFTFDKINAAAPAVPAGHYLTSVIMNFTVKRLTSYSSDKSGNFKIEFSNTSSQYKGALAGALGAGACTIFGPTSITNNQSYSNSVDLTAYCNSLGKISYSGATNIRFSHEYLYNLGSDFRAEASITWNYDKYSYTVTFNNWNGDIIKTQTVKYGSTPTVPSNPTKTSTAQYTYIFSGWSPSLGAITGDTTYTAQFTSRRNGIYAGTSRAKAIYVGTTPVKAIYVGTTKVYEQ